MTHASQEPSSPRWLKPWVIAAGIAGSLGIVVLNFAAAQFADGVAWLAATDLVVDLAILGAGIVAVVRVAMSAEAETARMQTALDATQARLAAIVDSAMDALITVDEAHNIVLFNRAAEQVFKIGREQALGAPLDRFIPHRYRAAHRNHIEKFGQASVTSRRMGDATTLWGLRADGEEFPLEASISQAADGGRRYFTVILRDITLRRQAEVEAERVRGALSEAHVRLGAIVDSAMDAVITVDEQQSIVLFNRAAEQLFGVPHERMLGTPLERLIPARFRDAHHGHVETFGRTGVTSRRMGDVTTLWALRPESGEEFPIEASISQATEGGRRYFTVILRDITLRKETEDALKRSEHELRELSARMVEAREEEKTRIARELHDELGQLLSGLRMDLVWMREQLPTGDEVSAKTEEMVALVDRTVAATRRIAADLRPMMLDDLGLADAANWLVEDFAKRSGIECRMQFSGNEALEGLSKSVSIAVYRAIQESLTNIGRHSGARRAWVVFLSEGGWIYVEVEDDGRGIAPQDLAKVRSLGLKGMRERISYLGGSLEIARAPRGGTRLRVSVPLRGRSHGEPT